MVPLAILVAMERAWKKEVFSGPKPVLMLSMYTSIGARAPALAGAATCTTQKPFRHVRINVKYVLSFNSMWGISPPICCSWNINFWIWNSHRTCDLTCQTQLSQDIIQLSLNSYSAVSTSTQFQENSVYFKRCLAAIPVEFTQWAQKEACTFFVWNMQSEKAWNGGGVGCKTRQKLENWHPHV